MKTNIASTLIYLAVASAFEVADIYKPRLGNQNCHDAHLTDSHTLSVTCHEDPHTAAYTLDLDKCFANYDGNLRHVTDGNGRFSASCPFCFMDKTKLTCSCWISKERGTQITGIELDDYHTVQVGRDGLLQCSDMFGIEKRVNKSESRAFAA